MTLKDRIKNIKYWHIDLPLSDIFSKYYFWRKTGMKKGDRVTDGESKGIIIETGIYLADGIYDVTVLLDDGEERWDYACTWSKIKRFGK